MRPTWHAISSRRWKPPQGEPVAAHDLGCEHCRRCWSSRTLPAGSMHEPLFLHSFPCSAEELRHSVPTVQEVPAFLRGALCCALLQAWRCHQEAHRSRGRLSCSCCACCSHAGLMYMTISMFHVLTPTDGRSRTSISLEHRRGGRQVLLDGAWAFPRGEMARSCRRTVGRCADNRLQTGLQLGHSRAGPGPPVAVRWALRTYCV